jgi:hypothetical protein
MTRNVPTVTFQLAEESGLEGGFLLKTKVEGNGCLFFCFFVFLFVGGFCLGRGVVGVEGCCLVPPQMTPQTKNNMTKFLHLALVLAAPLAASARRLVPEYTINLDLPPQERYDALLTNKLFNT